MWEPKPKPTVGIITTCGTYENFLPGWARSIRGLQRQPDKIVIAASDPMAAHKKLQDERIEYSIVPMNEPFQFGTYLNAAIDACNTDWIAWIGCDDRYRYNALNGIDIVDADIYVFGMQIAGSGQWRGGNVSDSLAHNPIPCGSPFQRWIWEILPFQPELAPFEDWAFWAGAKSLGATSKSTGRIDFDYAQHPNQIIPQQEPAATYVREWARNL